MFLQKIIKLPTITHIYNSLKYIDYEDFSSLRRLCYNHIDFKKSFDIINLIQDQNYNIKLLQMFDNTRINLMYDTTYIVLSGAMIINKSKLITGYTGLIDKHNKFQTIYNPYKINTICLQVEHYKKVDYFLR